jgi:hypothetical protein
MARIDDYHFGRIVIDGHEETSDVIVLPRRTVTHWWRRRGHELVLEDLEDVVDELPEHLLIGTGAEGRLRPDPSLIERLQVSGVSVEVLTTPEAVRRYRERSPRNTAAALHVTC